MHKYIFPNIPADWAGSEEEWEDYCALVWCCKSLNAAAGTMRISDFPLLRIYADYMERAQSVISFYVNERRRLLNEQ